MLYVRAISEKVLRVEVGFTFFENTRPLTVDLTRSPGERSIWRLYPGFV